MPQTWARLLLGIITILLTLAASVLLCILVASISLTQNRKLAVLLLIAVILEALLCLSLGLLLLRYQTCTSQIGALNATARRKRRYLVLVLAGLVPGLLAAAMTAAAFSVFTNARTERLFGRPVPAVAFVVWVSSLVFQLIFLFVLGSSSNVKGHSPAQQLPLETQITQIHQTSRPPTSSTSISNPFSEIKSTVSPSISAVDGTSSIRSSFSTHRRPTSSKKGLSIRSQSQPRHSERSSSDGPSRRPSQDEGGFDAWDTSAVSPTLKDTVLQAKSVGKGVGLPTIPGSRSPSPAKALEGPFFDPSPEGSPPQSPLPQPSVSIPNSPVPGSTAFTNSGGRFPAGAMSSSSASPPSSPPQSQSRKFSRPPSLARRQSEEHNIHPLFRSCSPTPPPSASSNTVVTAAPEAGVFINRQTLHRMRSTSQPPNSSPLQRSESFGNIREVTLPSPSVTSNEQSPSVGARRGALHQRKRSASFEGCIIRPEM